MAQLKRTPRILLLAALAALAASALLASAASASVLPAKFSSSQFKLTTTGITIKRNGTEAKTCTPVGNKLEGFAESNQYVISNELGGSARFWCSNNTELTMAWLGEALYDTVANRYSLRIASHSGETLTSPFGQYLQEPGTTGGTWTNGSGSTPSKLTFSNETLGFTYPGGQKLTIEGTFTVTTLSGGLITLSH